MIGGEFNKNLVSVNGTVCTGRKVIVQQISADVEVSEVVWSP